MSRIEGVLDQCLDALLQGQSIEDCLTQYPDLAEELEPLLVLASITIASAGPNPRLKEETLSSIKEIYQDQEGATQLQDALSHSIDLLMEGYSIDDCLSRYPTYTSALKPLLEMAEIVRDTFAVQPREGFKEELRGRISIHRTPERRPIPLLGFLPIPMTARWAAVLAAIFLIPLGALSAVMASGDSVPGDLLYPLKEVKEKVQLTLATSPSKQMETHVKLANERMQEMSVLAIRGDYKGVKDLTTEVEGHLKGVSLIMQEEQKKSAVKLVFNKQNKQQEAHLMDQVRELRAMLGDYSQVNTNLMNATLPKVPSSMRKTFEDKFMLVKTYYTDAMRSLELGQPVADMDPPRGRVLTLAR